MSYSTMEYDYFPEEPEKKKGFSVGKLLKYIAYALIVLVYALLFFRIFISNDTSLAKSFVWTEKSVAAYDEKGGISVYSQELKGYTLYDENGEVSETVSYSELSEDGLFKISNFMYVKDTREVIITLRYNDTCEKTYSEKYSLDPNSTELFVFELRGGEKTYSDYVYLTDERFVYHYRRLVFSDVDIENAKLLSLVGYCVGNPDKEESVFDMTVYDSHVAVEAVNFKKLLPAELSPELKTPPYVKFD